MLFRSSHLLAAAVILASSCLVTALADEPVLLQEPALPPEVLERLQILVEPGQRPAPRPTTQAVARPATQPASPAQLQTWFKDLAASDAVARERAYSALLGITRQDLPALRDIVERSRPIAPSQGASLREIVTHVFLTGEPYEAEAKAGFLGVMQPLLLSVEVPGDQGQDGDEPLPPPRTGVPIEYRLPGFCGFQSLRDGDVVLGVVAPVERPLREWNELSVTIMTFRAGETVTFEILRGGRVIRVPVRLDTRPAAANARGIGPPEPAEVLPARTAKAEEYWTEHFAPLIEDRISSLAP